MGIQPPRMGLSSTRSSVAGRGARRQTTEPIDARSRTQGSGGRGAVMRADRPRSDESLEHRHPQPKEVAKLLVDITMDIGVSPRDGDDPRQMRDSLPYPGPTPR